MYGLLIIPFWINKIFLMFGFYKILCFLNSLMSNYFISTDAKKWNCYAMEHTQPLTQIAKP